MKSEVVKTDSEKGVTVVKYGETFIKIKQVEIENEVDPDKITRIDLNNLVAEIITTPVLVNRWGNILADTEYHLKKAKLKFEIFCAQKNEEIRKLFMENGGKKPTIAEVDDGLIQTVEYSNHKNKVIESEKINQIVNSIYWAVKDKSDKLNKLSLTIQKEDLENIQDTIINGIKIISRKNN